MGMGLYKLVEFMNPPLLVLLPIIGGVLAILLLFPMGGGPFTEPIIPALLECPLTSPL